MATFKGPRPIIIDAPPLVNPSVVGVLAVLPPHDLPHGARELFAGVTYESDGCEAAGRIVEPGLDGDADGAADECLRSAAKTFDEGLDFTQSFSFTVYRGIKCRIGSLGGGDEAEYKERSERRLTQGESRAVEQHLVAAFNGSKRDTQNEAIPPGRDITPTGDIVSVDEGVALLFEALGNIHSPVIHVPRPVAVMLNKDAVIEKSGGRTVVGAGYHTNGDGTATIYGTGPINFWRDPITTNIVYKTETNETFALSERQYIAAIECGVFSIRVRFAPNEKL